MLQARTAVALVILAASCKGQYRDGDDDVDVAGSEDSGGAMGSTGVVETSGPGMKLDVGAGGFDLGSGELDCEAVDFLFVIDNSSSMAREQMRLVEATPGFTDSIQNALPEVSHVRVGVVDTDRYPGLGTEDPLDGCPAGRTDCGSCDYALGALLTKPASAIDPASDCGFATGESWMDTRDPTFADEFACVAAVGTEGNQIEQQAGALVEALSPAMVDGGCNDGFLRDDALLIVLVLTDEEDDYAQPPEPQGGSLGEPDDWVDALVAAKGGRPENVVALGLIGGDPLFSDCDAAGNDAGAEASPRLQAMLEAFDTHFVASVCADDYVAFFDDALTTVAQGCAQFAPG